MGTKETPPKELPLTAWEAFTGLASLFACLVSGNERRGLVFMCSHSLQSENSPKVVEIFKINEILGTISYFLNTRYAKWRTTSELTCKSFYLTFLVVWLWAGIQ